MLPIVIVSLLGCPGPDDKDTDSGEDVAAICDAQDVQCEDDLVSLLLNEDKKNSGDINTTVDGDDFVTVVDATSGGSSQAASKGWVYVRFTEEGAEKVDITDGESLTSQDWHMALRRYNLRLNSGVSGPSCVMGASVRGDYADLTEAPAAEDFAPEAFFDDECETIVGDELGGPAYLLTEWWAYTNEGCIEPSGNAYAIQLEDGSVLKLTVESYYEDGEACSSAETGWITMRWAWL